MVLQDMYGEVVFKIPHAAFEAEMSDLKRILHARLDVELDSAALVDLVRRYKVRTALE
jgi:hypothetical protein